MLNVNQPSLEIAFPFATGIPAKQSGELGTQRHCGWNSLLAAMMTSTKLNQVGVDIPQSGFWRSLKQRLECRSTDKKTGNSHPCSAGYLEALRFEVWQFAAAFAVAAGGLNPLLRILGYQAYCSVHSQGAGAASCCP
jgi:hypothetical protein